jgi:hypothetical protein
MQCALVILPPGLCPQPHAATAAASPASPWCHPVTATPLGTSHRAGDTPGCLALRVQLLAAAGIPAAPAAGGDNSSTVNAPVNAPVDPQAVLSTATVDLARLAVATLALHSCSSGAPVGLWPPVNPAAAGFDQGQTGVNGALGRVRPVGGGAVGHLPLHAAVVWRQAVLLATVVERTPPGPGYLPNRLLDTLMTPSIP